MRDLVHDNGGTPYMISDEKLHEGKILIYKNNSNYHYDDDFLNTIDPPSLIIDDVVKFFVSERWNNYNDNMGGSFLVQIRDTMVSLGVENYTVYNYVFIGAEIFSFSTYYPIYAFYSPINNNDVPYPSAKDINDRQYLMLDKIVISPLPSDIDSENPYEYYYFGGKYHDTSEFTLWQHTFPTTPFMNVQIHT